LRGTYEVTVLCIAEPLSVRSRNSGNHCQARRETRSIPSTLSISPSLG
jgi:hypothetical protein